MKIDKVMNNNVVSSIDEDGQEIIVVGTGIGYSAYKINIKENGGYNLYPPFYRAKE